jgi:phosphoribosyl 1,2-cyclic phosphodiesterase
MLLVDAGISCRQVEQRLDYAFGRSLDDIDAVLITHEHSDHIKGLARLLKLKRRLAANRETLDGIIDCLGLEGEPENPMIFNNGDTFEIGDIKIDTFSTSHDAANPTGFAFENSGKRICIVTDTGCITDEIYDQMKRSDILVLESNHDENVLRMGPYPWFLKQRILSDRGHLSNETASAALADIIAGEDSQKQRIVLLAHLSKENNFPEMALATMENILRENGCKANSCIIRVLSRNEVSEIYG